MKSIIVIVAVAVAMSGCVGIHGFTKSDISGVGGSKTRIPFVEEFTDWSADNYLKEYFSKLIMPVFIKAENSAAVTAEGVKIKDKITPPKISTSLAVSVKAIGRKKMGFLH